jgi:hypothetical protein
MNTLGKGADLRAFRKTTTVEFPELDLSIRLRELSAGEIQHIGTSAADVAWLAAMIVDEHGELVFVDDPKDALNLSPSVLKQLVAAALKLNGISKEAADEALKNLQASQSGVTASA